MRWWVAFVVVLGSACGSEDPEPVETGGEDDRKIVFVTADTFGGGFGSVGEGDTICSARAAAAGLVGAYRAWLSAASDARDFVTDSRYVRTDGVTVAQSLTDLLDGSLENPIDRAEDGTEVMADVWTGTLSNGAAASSTCSGWTVGDSSERGQCGSTLFTNERWTENSIPSCGIDLHLFCFEQ